MPELPQLPRIADQPLSVVLLARNAGEHVATLLPAWAKELDKLRRPWEVLVADDGSTDGTADKAEKAVRQVRVLRRDGPPAEGRALAAALGQCRHPLIYTARLLPRYQPGDVTKFLVETRARRPETDEPCPEIDLVHLATGYRTGRPVPPAWAAVGTVWRGVQRVVLGTRPTPLPGWLGWRTHLAGLWWRLLFGVHNRDATSPCRLLRREVVPRLALQSEGSFVHVEILAKATFLGLILSEDIPLTERKRGGALPAEEYADAAGAWSRDFHNLLWRPSFGREPAATAAPT